MKRLLTYFLLLLSVNAYSTNYYVSSSGGNDSNTGLIGFPWKTCAKVNAIWLAGTFAPGDNILFNKGDIFYGKLIVSESGTADNPITVGAYGSGNQPIITGFVNLDSWVETSSGSHLWDGSSVDSSSSVSLSTCNMVMIGGVNFAMGRYPSTGYLSYESLVNLGYVLSGTIAGGSGYTNGTYTSKSLTGGSGTGVVATIVVSGGSVSSVTITTAGTNYNVGNTLTIAAASIGGTGSGFSYTITAVTKTITDNQLTTNPFNWTGSEVAIKVQRYVISRNLVTAQSVGTLTYTAVNGSSGQANWGYFFQNDVRTLTYPNAWYYNPSTKKLRIYSTVSPTSVKIASVDTLLYLKNYSYITVDNISFHGANQFGIKGLSTGGNYGANNTVQNCDFDFSGVSAIAVYPGMVGLRVASNTINHSNDFGIDAGASYSATITGNTVKNTGLFPGMGLPAISSFKAIHDFGKSVITYNSVDTAGYVGIDFDGDSTQVNFNYVNYHGFNLDDGGGIYTYPSQGVVVHATRRSVKHNIVLNGIGAGEGTSSAASQQMGIYLDGASYDFNVVGNTVANCFDGILLNNNHETFLDSNTLYNNVYNLDYENYDAVIPMTNVRLNHNIFFAKTASQLAAIIRIRGATMPASYLADNNYYARPIDDNLVFNTATVGQPATITLRNLAQWRTFSGHDTNSLKSPVTVTNTGQLDFQYNATGSPAVKTLPAGTWVDVRNASYSGTTTLQPYTSLILMSTGTLITPTITWSPPAITYLTTFGGSMTATSGGVPGSFVYTNGATVLSSSTVLNANSYSLTATFTPTDGATYSTATKTITFTVNPKPETLTYTVLSKVYTGSQLTPTVSCSPDAGALTFLTATYVGINGTSYPISSSPPTGAGDYTALTGINSPNYTATSISNTFTITKAAATFTVSNLSQIYNGTTRPITVTTTPAGLTVVSILYNGSGTAPTTAGSYTSTVISLSNANYQATPLTVTLTIAKATPVVSWATPADIIFGTPLSGTQLNATATGVSGSLAGAFTYTPASGTVLNAGASQVLSVNFAPTDATNYNSVTGKTVTINANKAVATITLSNLTQTFDGNPKPVTVTTNPIGLGIITTTYNGSTTAPSAVGTYAVNSSIINPNYTATPATGNLVISTSAAAIFITNLAQTYTGSPLPVTVTTNPAGLSYTITYNGSATVPTNAGTYTVIATINDGIHTGTDTQTYVISKATPVISWATPAAITFGTALSGTQLNASSPVAGSFVYTPPSGTVLSVGTQSLLVTLTPTDGSNYNVATKTVSIVVNASTVATLTLSNLAQVYNGTPKPVIVTSSPAGLSGITVTYNGSATAPTNAGSYAIVASLVNANYTATPVNGTEIIAQGSYTLAWTTPQKVKKGTALTVGMLNATSTIAGTFSYNPAAGYVLNRATTITGTFTPTDTVNYPTGSISVTIQVQNGKFNNAVLINNIVIVNKL